MKYTRFLFALFLVLLGSASTATLLIAGCNGGPTPADVASTNASLAKAQSDLAASRERTAELEAQLQQRQATNPSAATQAALEAAQAKLRALEQAQAAVTTHQSQINNPQPLPTDGVTAVTSRLPAPWGDVATLALVVGGVGIQEWRRKQAVDAAKSYIATIDDLRKDNTTVPTASTVGQVVQAKMAANKTTIKSRQNKTAKNLIAAHATT